METVCLGIVIPLSDVEAVSDVLESADGLRKLRTDKDGDAPGKQWEIRKRRIEKLFRVLEIDPQDVRNHDPPCEEDSHIVELVYDDSDSRIPQYDYWD